MATRTQAVIVALWLAGVLFLAIGVILTKFNWRSDAPRPPYYGVGSDVSIHPERYVNAKALRLVRLFNVIGAALCALDAMLLVVLSILHWL